MENATKALLIAAAVLVVIVIIALGVRLLGSAQDTSGKADDVSNALNTQLNSVSENVTNSLTKC